MSYIYQFPNPQTGKFPGNTIGVVAHGGAGKAFSASHPLVQFLHNFYASHVLSLELPNHGNREKDSIYEANPLVAINDIKEKLAPLISGKKVYFIGYSMGGIMLFHHMPYFQQIIHKDSLAIFIGIGIRTPLKNWDRISLFWTAKNFFDSKSDDDMARLHGPNWQLTIRTVHSWLTPNSPVWLSLETKKALFANPKKNIFFICGTDVTEPVEIDDVMDEMDKREIAARVTSIPCGHWTYFSTHWKMVQQIIKTMFLIYGDTSSSEPTSKM